MRMTKAKHRRCERALERFSISAPRYLSDDERREHIRKRQEEYDRLARIVADYRHRPSRERIKGLKAAA